MISKHSISVFLFGWLIVATYIYYDYTFHQTNVFEHFLSFKTPGNIFFNAIIFCTLIGSHITGYFINDRKKLFLKTIDSEKQLKHAAHEWVTTFDSIPYGVLVTDNKYNIIRANNYVADLSGLTVKELVSNKKCYETVCKQKPDWNDAPL